MICSTCKKKARTGSQRGSMAKTKGKSGEDEMCKWLDKNLKLNERREFNEPTRREHFQASGSDTDIIVDDFIIEVKRREGLDLDSWWWQVCVAAKNHPNKDLIPVVAFRQNRMPWEFLLPAKLIGLDKGYVRLAERAFIDYAKKLIGDVG